MRLCHYCGPQLERPAVFKVRTAEAQHEYVCTKHATQMVASGLKAELLSPGSQVCLCPPGECTCTPPPAAPPKTLMALELENLAKHARDAGAGVCTLEASELLELVRGYRP